MDKDKKYFAARAGNMAQHAYVRRSVMTDGKADGLRVIDIDNGSGLFVTLLEGRCLDIASVKYKGVNISFLAKAGYLDSSQCNELSGEFVRYFYGGMLTTCGLSNFGPDSEKDGAVLPVHGRIGITPASDVSAKVDWDNGVIKVSGDMTQAALFGQNLTLHRVITIPLFDGDINIKDTVINNGFTDEDMMILYHFNFGYPMLSEHLKISVDHKKVEPRDDIAATGIEKWDTFEEPTAGRPEEVFYHYPTKGDDGLTRVKLINDNLNIEAQITFNTDELPELVQWKSMMSGDYALGIEPATARVGGYHVEKEAGRVITLAPDESRTFHLTLSLMDR